MPYPYEPQWVADFMHLPISTVLKVRDYKLKHPRADTKEVGAYTGIEFRDVERILFQLGIPI